MFSITFITIVQIIHMGKCGVSFFSTFVHPLKNFPFTGISYLNVHVIFIFGSIILELLCTSLNSINLIQHKTKFH